MRRTLITGAELGMGASRVHDDSPVGLLVGKLSLTDSRDRTAWVGVDGAKLGSSLHNHEIDMVWKCFGTRGNRQDHGSSAVRIHDIRALNGHVKNVAIDAYCSRCLRVALSVEGLPAYAAERTRVRSGKDRSCVGIAEASAQAAIGAAWLSLDVRTMAERRTRAGFMKRVHKPAMNRSAARRLGARLRARLRMRS